MLKTMYIKKARKSNKVYEYLHLVDNVRTKKGPRQRLILNLGDLDIPQEQYKELTKTWFLRKISDRVLLSIPPPASTRCFSYELVFSMAPQESNQQ
jgi:hypothetical protein